MKNNYTEQQYITEELLALAAANLELDETRKK